MTFSLHAASKITWTSFSSPTTRWLATKTRVKET
jgi:hypothetical protein